MSQVEKTLKNMMDKVPEEGTEGKVMKKCKSGSIANSSDKIVNNIQ